MKMDLQNVVNKPKPFTPNEKSVDEDWYIWKNEFINYLNLVETYSKLSKKRKALLLINLMGKEAILAKEKMIFENPDEEEDIEILLKKFDKIFNSPINEMKQRYTFFSRRKYSKESFDDYITVIKEQAEKCNFGNQANKLIVDKIILSMTEYQRQHFFSNKSCKISLADALQYYKENCCSNESIKSMSILKQENFIVSTRKHNYLKNYKKEIKHIDCKSTSKHSVRKESFEKTDVNKKLVNALSNCEKQNLNEPGSIVKKRDGKARPVCSKCKTNHPYRQCPAHHKKDGKETKHSTLQHYIKHSSSPKSDSSDSQKDTGNIIHNEKDKKNINDNQKDEEKIINNQKDKKNIHDNQKDEENIIDNQKDNKHINNDNQKDEATIDDLSFDSDIEIIM